MPSGNFVKVETTRAEIKYESIRKRELKCLTELPLISSVTLNLTAYAFWLS